jgi:hypothetical protein
VAIATGASISSRARLINAPDLEDLRNVTMLFVFGL